MASGEMSPAEFVAFLRQAFGLMRASAIDCAVHYAFIDWRHAPELQEAAKDALGSPQQMCVWVKDRAGMGSFYRSQHELVFVFRPGAGPHINHFDLGQHGRHRTNVWSYPSISGARESGEKLLALHPTVKPVSLIADALRDCSDRKGVVLDPFAGSGTILIAAERTGRHARAIELDPSYVDVAIQRWQRRTQRPAKLAATGQTFEAVSQQRAASAIKGGGNEF